MTVSAETYIVISLMFAVFAAVAAVGTSVVLGAGFERLRAGFDHIKRQSGFFADAIYKLDQRTQLLDEETAKLKSGFAGVHDRMDRVEKQTSFAIDAVGSLEQRILQGTPTQPAADQPKPKQTDGLYVMNAAPQARSVDVKPEAAKPAVQDFVANLHVASRDDIVHEPENLVARMFDEERPVQNRSFEKHVASDVPNDNDHEAVGGLSTLLSRYFSGEDAKGVIYH